jgi:hypothetical protein
MTSAFDVAIRTPKRFSGSARITIGAKGKGVLPL